MGTPERRQPALPPPTEIVRTAAIEFSPRNPRWPAAPDKRAALFGNVKKTNELAHGEKIFLRVTEKAAVGSLPIHVVILNGSEAAVKDRTSADSLAAAAELGKTALATVGSCPQQFQRTLT